MVESKYDFDRRIDAATLVIKYMNNFPELYDEEVRMIEAHASDDSTTTFDSTFKYGGIMISYSILSDTIKIASFLWFSLSEKYFIVHADTT